MILAIETASSVCSVALGTVDRQIIEKRATETGMHSEKLFFFLDELLKEQKIAPARLKEVLMSRGPGQYTGLRIGAAGLKGFLFGLDTPFYAVGTLEGFAAGLICKKKVVGTVYAVLDARRQHLYVQRFQVSGERINRGKAAIETLTDIDRKLKAGDTVVGTGLERLSSYGNPSVRFYEQSQISAVNLIRARLDPRFREWFRREEPAEFEPEYLTTRQVKTGNGE